VALIEQSKIDSDSSVDRFYEMGIVDLRIVNVTADFMTDHFGGGVWYENIPSVVRPGIVDKPLIVQLGRNDDRHTVMNLG
jgi:hypothetical protein